MALLDLQGPLRGFRAALKAGRWIGSPTGDLWSALGFFGVGVGLLLGFAASGCRQKPPPAAASNEVFTSPSGRMLDRQGVIDDRWASVVLDESQRAEVRAILEEAVVGPVSPPVPARYGIRFEDTPHALTVAAPTVEMAILDSSHEPAKASVTYLDRRGREAIASIRLRARGPLARVDYRVPGDDAALERAHQLVDLQDRLDAAMEQAGSGLTARSAEAIVRASVRSLHGRVLSSGTEPEQYRYTLLMLDGEEATLTVRREPDPRVLSVEGRVGLFEDGRRAESLERAFMESLEAWGRTPQPERPRAGVDVSVPPS